jgi:argininosuccinate lyase
VNNPTPDGYLGSDARISSGPAPELIAAGYALELADAPLLHDGLLYADLAHVIALSESGLLDTETAGKLLAGLLEMGEVSVNDFPYDVVLGDAYNSREKELDRRLGATAGYVHLGRTRREAGRIAFRLAIRDRIELLAIATAGFVDALSARAEEFADAPWADVTYLQLAQPSTFGHYLASFAEEAARHLPRLRMAHSWVDVSPAGSGGVAGTRMSLDRSRLAELLGFGAVGRNTRDTMWTIDGLIDVTTAAVQTVITADRLAEDLLIFASAGFGLVTIDASLCRASVLMPQKRNPYALSVIRAGASTMVGRLTGTVTTARTPSASTDNWLHTYGEVASSLELARRLVELATAVVRTLHINREALAASAADQQTASTDIADELVLTGGLDYRTAYRIVGRTIAHALSSGERVNMMMLNQSAIAVTGSGLPAAAQNIDLNSLLDVASIVGSRHESGGCSPQSVLTEVADLRMATKTERDWFDTRRETGSAAITSLVKLARDLAEAFNPSQ